MVWVSSPEGELVTQTLYSHGGSTFTSEGLCPPDRLVVGVSDLPAPPGFSRPSSHQLLLITPSVINFSTGSALCLVPPLCVRHRMLT